MICAGVCMAYLEHFLRPPYLKFHRLHSCSKHPCPDYEQLYKPYIQELMIDMQSWSNCMIKRLLGSGGPSDEVLPPEPHTISATHRARRQFQWMVVDILRSRLKDLMTDCPNIEDNAVIPKDDWDAETCVLFLLMLVADNGALELDGRLTCHHRARTIQ